MATTVLVGASFEQDGKRLVERVDRAGVPIGAAFWTYPSDGGEGSVVIASPTVDEEGKLPVYQQVTAALRQSPALSLSLSAIFAIGVDDPVVRALSQQRASSGEFDATINFSTYAPYAPYLPEGQSSLRVHVFRLESPADTAKQTDHAHNGVGARP